MDTEHLTICFANYCSLDVYLDDVDAALGRIFITEDEIKKLLQKIPIKILLNEVCERDIPIKMIVNYIKNKE